MWISTTLASAETMPNASSSGARPRTRWRESTTHRSRPSTDGVSTSAASTAPRCAMRHQPSSHAPARRPQVPKRSMPDCACSMVTHDRRRWPIHWRALAGRPPPRPPRPTMSDRLAVLPQYLLPKQALTSLMGALARWEGGAATTAVIRWFVRRYGVAMDEAAEPDVARYRSFNEFFTRALRPGVRPLATSAWICPVDGAISQFGAIEGERIVQAKGHHYTTTALIGGDAALARRVQGGHFATLYLSLRDYHRI